MERGNERENTVSGSGLEQAFSLIDEADAVAFLQQLIAINSVNPPGNETAVAEAIRRRLTAAGIQAELDEVEPQRANLLAVLNKADASLSKKGARPQRSPRYGSDREYRVGA